MSTEGSQSWTIGRMLQWTTEYLKKHGSPTPRLDAEVLLAHVLGCPRIELYTQYDSQPEEHQRAAYRELIRRRSQGVPVAYLVGWKEFFSLSFRVTPQVLIPRPETEFVITALLDEVKKRQQQGERLWIADVGTGSGVLAICAARMLPQAQVLALDISVPALTVAQENALRHEVLDRVHLLQADLLQAVAPECLDYVISNPPYLSQQELEQAPAELKHEPRVALVAGPTGTEVVRSLVAQAWRCLRPGGTLICEISPMIHQAVLELLDPQRWTPPQTVKDLAGLPRVVVASRAPSS